MFKNLFLMLALLLFSLSADAQGVTLGSVCRMITEPTHVSIWSALDGAVYEQEGKPAPNYKDWDITQNLFLGEDARPRFAHLGLETQPEGDEDYARFKYTVTVTGERGELNIMWIMFNPTTPGTDYIYFYNRQITDELGYQELSEHPCAAFSLPEAYIEAQLPALTLPNTEGGNAPYPLPQLWPDDPNVWKNFVPVPNN